MKKVFLVFLIVITASCKSNKEEPVKEENIVIVSYKFKVEFSLKYPEPATIALSGNDLFVDNITSMNIVIKQKVTKSEGLKRIVLEWPENIEPNYSTALNLGRGVKSVVIKETILSYGEKEFIISPQEFRKYFVPNRYINYTPETGVLIINEIDGKRNPMLYMNRNTIDKLIN